MTRPPRELARPNRRELLAWLGAAAAAGCTEPPARTVASWHRPPPDQRPGEPAIYATATQIGGRAIPLWVQTRDGRPVKLDANPDHDFGVVGTTAIHQAMLMDLYDPARLRTPLRDGQPATWSDFDADAAQSFEAARSRRGAGLYILSGHLASPTLLAIRQQLLDRLPEAHWLIAEPEDEDHEREGLRAVFGRDLVSVPRLRTVDTILCLDCDFLGADGDVARNTRQFAERRADTRRPVHLVAVESALTLTGAQADCRRALRPDQLVDFAWVIAGHIARRRRAQGLDSAIRRRFGEADAPILDDFTRDATAAITRRRGGTVVLVGRRPPPVVHALAALINDAIGARGRGVRYHVDPRRPEGAAGDRVAMRTLADALRAGRVDRLVTFGGDPVATAAGDLELPALIDRATARIHVAWRTDVTSRGAQWVLPRAHFLETWGDVVTADGLVALQQPAARPLHGARSDLEIAATLGQLEIRDGRALVRAQWRKPHDMARREATAQRDAQVNGGADQPRAIWPSFDNAWRDGLARGAIGTRLSAPHTIAPGPEIDETWLIAEAANGVRPQSERTDLVFAPSATLYDGRFAGNPWLREQPDPITGVAWHDVVAIGPDTAAALGVRDGDLVRIALGDHAVTRPACIVAGTPDRTAVLTSGHDPAALAPLRRLARPGFTPGAVLVRTGDRGSLCRHEPAAFAPTTAVDGLVRVVDRDDAATQTSRGRSRELAVPRPGEPGFAWRMVIDSNACTGCRACVVACALENDVPPVGPDSMTAGRSTDWIRIASRKLGDHDAPRIVYQPVMCQHCSAAPCESACPTRAVHTSPEGINEQVYARCGGDGACITACPFGARRMRSIDASRALPALVRLGRNPDVVARPAGVAEKCTLCVQRIERAKRSARLARDDTAARSHLVGVDTACARACPAGAITFGLARLLDAAWVAAAPLSDGGDLGTSVRYRARVWRADDHRHG